MGPTVIPPSNDPREQPPRPHSAAVVSSSAQSQSHQQNGNGSKRTLSASTAVAAERSETDLYNVPNLMPALFSSDNDNGIDLEKTMGELSLEELKNEVRNLRSYVKHDLRKKVEEQMLNDLSGHETVQYIKAVEDERDHYRKQVSNLFFPPCHVSLLRSFECVPRPFLAFCLIASHTRSNHPTKTSTS